MKKPHPAAGSPLNIELRITLPEWALTVADPAADYTTDEAKMRLAIELARQNVERSGGGPFGAAVFAQPEGRLVAVGVNRVERLHNSAMHAEIVALMMAQAALQSHTLRGPALPTHELVTSCAPCAMCLGAALWSGVQRIVCGAGREDAERLGFDEGPVFPESYRYLHSRGITVVHGVLADDARAVLRLYAARGGTVYNA